MRSKGIRSLLIVLLMLPISHHAMAQSETSDTSFTSDDGLVTVVVPNGAVPDGADITVTYRPSEDAPEELVYLAGAGAPSHYLVEPTDVSFDPPARFIRRVPLAPLGQTAAGPQVMGMLAVRDTDGRWAWLSDLRFQVDGGSEELVLSGDLPHGGSVFAFGTGVIWAGIGDLWGYLGEVEATADFSIQSFLGVSSTDGDFGVSMTDVRSTTDDETVATAAEPVPGEVDGLPVATLPFECLQPGTTGTGLTLVLDGVGDDVTVTQQLELPATSVDVEVTGSIECIG